MGSTLSNALDWVHRTFQNKSFSVTENQLPFCSRCSPDQTWNSEKWRLPWLRKDRNYKVQWVFLKVNESLNLFFCGMRQDKIVIWELTNCGFQCNYPGITCLPLPPFSFFCRWCISCWLVDRVYSWKLCPRSS